MVTIPHSLSLGQSHVKKLENEAILLENFEDNQVGELPGDWYDRDGNKLLYQHSIGEQKTYKYKIQNEGKNKFLRYKGTRAKHISFPLINEEKENIYDINLYETPILSWKVRAHKLPKGANEKSSDRNDSVASIYVVFDMGRVALVKKVPKSIRYTWSTTLPEGETGSKLFGNQQIIVVNSGEQDKGKWVTFERNLVEDYRRMFGDDPPKNPIAILILSDGDSTNSYVKADYDDILLKPEK
ncbi:hypothetical protein CK503_01000 [Aliifodinibius salipaludis]|uniref:DUF3047 domain-containing protein n=1 Tax=Fodinibius salipaludis TaxID=2032627 RepID=A0A2A2GDQ8_9BACT|nr:DUF3047 domain-containing protein [Aliifodinibius salipaludis]PAU95671.1 hypothetical protein CK503_01000 [Aliifodinibius salipaludis]